MDKSKDNSINYFSFLPKNSKNIHQNDEYEYNPQKKNPLSKNNFCKRCDLNPDLGTEDNFNPNENLADSNILEAISDSSKQDITVCEFINIPKKIKQGSINNKIYYKNKKKIFLSIKATKNRPILIIKKPI